MSEYSCLADWSCASGTHYEYRPDIDHQIDVKNMINGFMKSHQQEDIKDQLRAEEYKRTAVMYFTIRIIEGLDKAEAFLEDYLSNGIQ